MDATTFLAAASAIVWIGIGAYVAILGLEQRKLSNRLKQWELSRHDKC